MRERRNDRSRPSARIAFGVLLVLAAGIAMPWAHPLTPIRLQQLIDTTPTGGTLVLEAGFHVGPAVVDRPMRIEGRAGAQVDGRLSGTILTVRADDVAIVGLHFTRSGDRNDGIDAAIALEGKRALVEDNVIEDCLYGIRIQQSDANTVRRNRIASQDLPEARRGDGVRIWYSTGNLVEENDISGVRDGVAVQAVGNRVRANRVTDSRYGALLLYGDGTELVDNRFFGNAVGVMAIGSNDVTIARNAIRSGRDVAGQAILLKDSNRIRVIENDLFASARGLYLDASPTDPEAENVFSANRIAFNGTAITFHSDLAGNRFEANRFDGNHADVVVEGGGAARRAVWRANAWDAYVGFDRDGDGVGDTPHEVWAWSDVLWMDVPAAQLFRSSPAVTLVDFVERLAPFVEPRLLLVDEAPKISGSAAALPPSPNRDRSR